ncbi:WD40 repeat domain-containing protein [Desulforhabdus sp. TSK]|uniref:WD40 repeat domain-containing protein n=1 Tax=Desulforhabdus sp. TSK TaxID=2925014 RepID=UPI001FC7D237|nr:hypothetical protein [Desulforhabdus sp. TSK]GKT09219.1 hypothetical protein DSTSK_25240 [Desulforhabdus sp. TSK]
MKHRSLGILAMVFVLCALAGAFSPAEAKDFLFVPVSNALQIVDCDTDTVVKTVPAYNDYIMSAAPSADGKRYYLNAQHSVYVFDTATHQLIDTFRLSSDLNRVTILGFAVSEDGGKLYLSCSITKKKQNVPKLNVLPPQLLVFDIPSKQVVQSFEIPYCVSGVFTLRNDPNHLMLVGLDIHKIQLSDGKLEKVFGFLHPDAGGEPANNFIIWYNQSPGDPGIFVNAYYTPSAMYFLNLDRNTGEIKSVKASDIFMLYSCVLSPDKKYVYAAMDDVVKFDAQTGATIKSVTLERGTSYAVSITSDGKKLYVGPSGTDITVFDTETMTQLGTIPLEADGVAVHRISQ